MPLLDQAWKAFARQSRDRLPYAWALSKGGKTTQAAEIMAKVLQSQGEFAEREDAEQFSATLKRAMKPTARPGQSSFPGDGAEHVAKIASHSRKRICLIGLAIATLTLRQSRTFPISCSLRLSIPRWQGAPIRCLLACRACI